MAWSVLWRGWLGWRGLDDGVSWGSFWFLRIFLGFVALLCFSSVWTISRIACVHLLGRLLCHWTSGELGRHIHPWQRFLRRSCVASPRRYPVRRERLQTWCVVCFCVAALLLMLLSELFHWWLKLTSCRKFDGRHVKFARERGVVCCRMVSILIISASKARISFKPVCIGITSIAYRLSIYEDKKNLLLRQDSLADVVCCYGIHACSIVRVVKKPQISREEGSTPKDT